MGKQEPMFDICWHYRYWDGPITRHMIEHCQECKREGKNQRRQQDRQEVAEQANDAD